MQHLGLDAGMNHFHSATPSVKSKIPGFVQVVITLTAPCLLSLPRSCKFLGSKGKSAQLAISARRTSSGPADYPCRDESVLTSLEETDGRHFSHPEPFECSILPRFPDAVALVTKID